MIWKRFGSRTKGLGGVTLIARDATVEGTINFNGVLEIEGRVEGGVRARDNERAAVHVLPGGFVQGNVSAPQVVINGTVTGNVHSSDHVELALHAVINGDVSYNLLEISRGAQVNGRLLFNGPAAVRSAEEAPLLDVTANEMSTDQE